MPVPLLSVPSSPQLPAAADVVVIGGGIIGVSAAYFLAKRGVSVALLEKGMIGAEQSSRNWGWCRQQNRDARELPLATRSLELWDELVAELGPGLGFRRSGLLYLSNDEKEIEGWAEWCRFAATMGVTSHPLSREEATSRGAITGKSWKGGVFSPSDGIADPARAAPMIAEGIMRFGGTVHQSCAARGLEKEGGRVSAVVTEKGAIRTRQVVMAGGAWASSFCRQFGVVFPQASIRSSVLSVEPGAEGLLDALHTADVTVTRRGDGGYTLAVSGMAKTDPTLQQLRFARYFLPMFAKRWRSLSPGDLTALRAGHETIARWSLDRPTPMERMRILDPAPSTRATDKILSRARTLLPALKQVPVQARWAGYVDSTPDGVPVIDPNVGPGGFLLAAGFSGHGFGIGPGAGQLIADLVTGAEPSVDYKQYALSRFGRSARGKVAEF
ncbi:FAD-binding oxidoreductase [Afifella sp. JA880]|uniref:NAD(P)/FAD-dependent oxidoreductase n=1 Tax=Afifella sp. JA880 TaxID=2975280 RepID=UPI0021BAFE8C|nr:FAD-binding oxidoreductase [Afifella sp. JA880]MCT8266306.1 FAD-binding oxidoreductase [Afifella sp. JA880]